MIQLDAAQWWHRADLFTRYCCDVVEAEIGRARPHHDFAAKPISRETPFGEEGLGLDSLERLRVTQAVADALQLSPGDPLDAMVGSVHLEELVRLAISNRPLQTTGASFLSSGSQGIPKRICHTWDGLHRELDHWRQTLISAQRIIALVPSHHIYGFIFTVIVPAMLGIPVVDARRRLPMSVAASAMPGDVIVGHPLFWGIAHGTVWPERTCAISSGGAVNRSAYAALTAQGMGEAFEIYGSTETSGIALRQADESDFSLLPWWDRDGDEISSAEGGRIQPPDIVEWTSDRTMRPVKRRDGQVQVAGTNVSPGKIAAVLRAHPKVSDARARLMVSGEGERIKAFIVPAGSSEGLVAELELWCSERLIAPERPKAWTLGNEIPKTAEGKDADWAIVASPSS